MGRTKRKEKQKKILVQVCFQMKFRQRSRLQKPIPPTVNEMIFQSSSEKNERETMKKKVWRKISEANQKKKLD